MLSAGGANLTSEQKASRPTDPCVKVILVASGDLTKRKLIPAHCNLAKDNLRSKEFGLAEFARKELASEEFRPKTGEEISQFATTEADPDLWHRLQRRAATTASGAHPNDSGR